LFWWRRVLVVVAGRFRVSCRGWTGSPARIACVKSSGSVWFVYGIAVVVTFLVGTIAFSVFVLSKVFSSSPAEPAPVPAPIAQAEPTPAPTTPPVIRTTTARVFEIRPVSSNPRQVVLIVATPVGCVRKLQAAAYAEGPGAVAVRVTQQAYRAGCRWQRKSVLATAKAPFADRTLVVNGALWTTDPTGRYQPALRTATS
jgi:hypothetical protein